MVIDRLDLLPLLRNIRRLFSLPLSSIEFHATSEIPVLPRNRHPSVDGKPINARPNTNLFSVSTCFFQQRLRFCALMPIDTSTCSLFHRCLLRPAVVFSLGQAAVSSHRNSVKLPGQLRFLVLVIQGRFCHVLVKTAIVHPAFTFFPRLSLFLSFLACLLILSILFLFPSPLIPVPSSSVFSFPTFLSSNSTNQSSFSPFLPL